MNSLVGYASSDDDADEILPERPAKIAKTESIAVPAESANDRAPSPPANAPALQLPVQVQEEAGDINASHAAQASGPPAGPTVTAQAPSASLDEPPFSPYTYERQRLRELTMPTVPNFDIPDSPPPPPQNSEEAAALAATTKKFERFLELKKQGIHFNERLQNSSSLRNPSLLPKLMDFAGISTEDSYASSLPEELGVPVKWPEGSYVENLLRQNERKEKKRLMERDKMDFVPASKSGGSNANGMLKTNERTKRSKFDR